MKLLKWALRTASLCCLLIPLSTLIGLIGGIFVGVTTAAIIGDPELDLKLYLYSEFLLLPLTAFLAIIRITLFFLVVWLPIWATQSKHIIFTKVHTSIAYGIGSAALFLIIGRLIDARLFGTNLVGVPFEIARNAETILGAIVIFAFSSFLSVFFLGQKANSKTRQNNKGVDGAAEEAV